MLRPSRSHEQYQAFLKDSMVTHFGKPSQFSVLFVYANLIGKMWLTDLPVVSRLVAPCYSSSPRGTPPRDPVNLFRSLLLMCLAHYTSITDWVSALKAFPFFAILSGFEPDNALGVGIFYDFMNRLWLAENNARKKLRKALW